MRIRILCPVLLSSLCFVPLASAQYISVAAGGLFPQNLSAPVTVGSVTSTASASFSRPSIITADGGIGFLPFIGLNLHYSYSQPELRLRRGDAFGSSAVLDLPSHTLTLDAKFRARSFFGFRPFAFAGVGFTRFKLNIKSQVEVPFPKGIPSSEIAPVGTYGGGIEKKFVPLVAAKVEIRDYVTPIPSSVYQPGGAWHRLAVVAGIVLGR